MKLQESIIKNLNESKELNESYYMMNIIEHAYTEIENLKTKIDSKEIELEDISITLQTIMDRIDESLDEAY